MFVLSAVMTQNPLQSANAAVNAALQFNGTTQYVTFGAAPSLGLATFTLEAWIKRTGTGVSTSTSAAGGGGLSNVVPIISKGRGEGDGSNIDMNYILGIDTVSNKLAVDFEEGVGGTGPLGQNHSLIGNTVVTSNVWHHVAATYNGTWTIYLDGTPDGSLVVNQPARADSIQHAGIGTAMTSTGAAAGFFQGVIDEVRIWSVARDATQIAGARDQELTAGTGLVARWGLNDGTGTNVSNSVGGGVVGTVNNGPVWTSGFKPTDTSSVLLDGTNDYVTFGPAPSLGVTSFTLETWFRRDGAGVGVTTGTSGITSAIPLITKAAPEGETPNAINANYFLGIDAATGQLVADFEEPTGPNHPITGNAVVTNNVWHHAAVTYDATTGTWNLYLDGALDKTLALGSAFQPNSASTEHAGLGTSMTSTGTAAGFFKGAIDEARIWSVVRSAGQIAAAKNQELTSGSGLIARWG